jgi:carboxyl-terminal processing protease
MTLKNSSHPVRNFVRGFAFGCLTLSILVSVVNTETRKESYWPMEAIAPLPLNKGEELVVKTFDVLDQNFYREITDDDLHEFIDGALQNLDPYSGYLSERSYRQLSGMSPSDKEEEAPYLIGVFGTTTETAFVVDATAPGSPADEAGLRPGDVLFSVEGEDVSGKTGKEAFDVLLAEVTANPGVPVKFGFTRGLELIETEIVSRQLAPTYVFDLGEKEDVAYIALTGFYPGATETLAGILKSYQDAGTSGVVLDLRSNGGGLVTEVEHMSSLFMEEGSLIYKTKSRIDGDQTFVTQGSAPFKDMKVAVLVNAESASASEILAGFFQAHQRGQVVGQTTYGKGTVQAVIPLDTDEGAVRVTIGYYTDAGDRKINGIGVTPDIMIDHNEGDVLYRMPRGVYDESLEKARSWILGDALPGEIASHPRPNLDTLKENWPL